MSVLRVPQRSYGDIYFIICYLGRKMTEHTSWFRDLAPVPVPVVPPGHLTNVPSSSVCSGCVSR